MTIQQHVSNADDQDEQRRTLGELEFAPGQAAAGSLMPPALALPVTPVAVDESRSMVFHSAFTPHNRGLSVMVGYRTPAGETHVFSALSTWGTTATATCYFAFRLPTGEFIELYFTP